MKSVILTLVSVLSAFAFTAHARLGESPKQIANRYLALSSQQYEGGQLYGLPSTNYVFKGMFIAVSFLDDKCVREAVSPLDDRDLTLNERNSFVKAIGGSKFGKSSDGKLWVGPDSARAVYANGLLRIQSGHFTKYWEARSRADKFPPVEKK